MELKVFCAWWGLDHLGVDSMLEQIKSWGYDGVEIGIPWDITEQSQLKKKLVELDLEVIGHQYQAHQSGFDAYKVTFQKALENAANFGLLKINSHTGRDFWSLDQNIELVEIAQMVEEKYGVPIIHETHRGRFLYSAPASRAYFDKLPGLKINLDISHWCCVSESLLEEQKDNVNIALQRTGHIHARIGHAQGPQVTDPRSPQFKNELHTFTNWWKEVYAIHHRKGEKIFTITPEFGPLPYSMSLPYSNKPFTDPHEINLWMKEYLKFNLSKL